MMKFDRERFMNVFIATLYGMIIWLSVMAYCIIVGGPLLKVTLWGPVIVSGFVMVVLAMDYGLTGAVKAFRRRYRKAVN